METLLFIVSLTDFSSNFNATNCEWILSENSDEICSGDVQKAEGCPVIDGKLLYSEITPQIIQDSQLYYDKSCLVNVHAPAL